MAARPTATEAKSANSTSLFLVMGALKHDNDFRVKRVASGFYLFRFLALRKIPKLARGSRNFYSFRLAVPHPPGGGPIAAPPSGSWPIL